MTAEEVALEEFRRAAKSARNWRRIRAQGQAFAHAKLGEAWRHMQVLARIIRAIREDERSRRKMAVKAFSDAMEGMLRDAYDQGRRDALRGVKGACGYGYGSLVLAAEACPDCTVKPGQPLGPLCDYHDGVHEALVRVAQSAEEAAR